MKNESREDIRAFIMQIISKTNNEKIKWKRITLDNSIIGTGTRLKYEYQAYISEYGLRLYNYKSPNPLYSILQGSKSEYRLDVLEGTDIFITLDSTEYDLIANLYNLVITKVLSKIKLLDLVLEQMDSDNNK